MPTRGQVVPGGHALQSFSSLLNAVPFAYVPALHLPVHPVKYEPLTTPPYVILLYSPGKHVKSTLPPALTTWLDEEGELKGPSVLFWKK